MSETDDVTEVERALERLFRMSAGRKLHDRQAAEVGAVVTRAGYALLRVLDDEGELSLGDLAVRCVMDAAAAGRQVRQLEADGFVERRAGADDARITFVRATPRGRRAYRKIVALRRAYMADVLAGWSGRDRKQLSTLVNRLVDQFKVVPVGGPGSVKEPTP
jgi:DNA-binding MarR family transcriptional regulator